MELILVNSVKLKIILTPKDMEEMDISNETLDYDSAKTRRAFHSILERARNETGFDTKHDKIYVQAFPSNDGGCEMFLTRRGKLLPEPGEKEATYFKKKYRLAGDEKRERKEYIAASDEIDPLIELCLRLKKEGFSGSSSLYRLDSRYYLVLGFSRRLPTFVKDIFADDDTYRFSFMSDYADLAFAERLALAKLHEHGECIAPENAVEIFAESFGRA